MAEFLCFGEIMLRLKSPGAERFLQSPHFEATFGGGEANVAVSLANYRLDAGFISVLPDNDIGMAAIRELRGSGVDTSHIHRAGNRVGTYYLETGANQRPSKVIYDRAGSSMAEAKPGEFDWKKIFDGARWFHITGITPALSMTAAALGLDSVQAAKAAGLTVSCDLNFRGKLWNYGKSAPEIMTALVEFVDVAIANEEDCQKSLGIDADVNVARGDLDVSAYESLSAAVLKRFPKLPPHPGDFLNSGPCLPKSVAGL